MKECPSCGAVITENVAFCPACGTKIEGVNKVTPKNVNKELESLLFTINSNAEVALSKNLGPGLIGGANYENLNKLENAYLEIIQKFPTEPKAYIAYVDYKIKYTLKINSLTNIFATTQYFVGDIDLIITRCKNYLLKAKEYATESDLETILQLETRLSSKVEAISNDDTIKQKQEKNKKIAKWCLIATGIFFVIAFIVWLITDM